MSFFSMLLMIDKNGFFFLYKIQGNFYKNEALELQERVIYCKKYRLYGCTFRFILNIRTAKKLDSQLTTTKYVHTRVY